MGHEDRDTGTPPQEEETATAAALDPWMRTRNPKGSPRLVSEGLESGSHLRVTENMEGPAWFGIPSLIVIFPSSTRLH